MMFRRALPHAAAWTRRGLQTSTGSGESNSKAVALSKLKDSFNDATSGPCGLFILSCALCSHQSYVCVRPWQMDVWCKDLMNHHPQSRNTFSAVSYLEELEKRFHEDPASVDRSWGSFFNNLGEWWGRRVY